MATTQSSDGAADLGGGRHMWRGEDDHGGVEKQGHSGADHRDDPGCDPERQRRR